MTEKQPPLDLHALHALLLNARAGMGRGSASPSNAAAFEAGRSALASAFDLVCIELDRLNECGPVEEPVEWDELPPDPTPQAVVDRARHLLRVLRDASAPIPKRILIDALDALGNLSLDLDPEIGTLRTMAPSPGWVAHAPSPTAALERYAAGTATALAKIAAILERQERR